MEFLLHFSLGFLLVFMSLFLIALVLIQRGRGGGLAGAFGGAGGQSAFGTKAGDIFTRITVLVASFWILLCILAMNVLGPGTSRISQNLGSAASQRVPPEVPVESATSDIPAAPAGDKKDATSETKKDVNATESTPAKKDPPAEAASPAEGTKAAPATPAPEAAAANSPADGSSKPATDTATGSGAESPAPATPADPVKPAAK